MKVAVLGCGPAGLMAALAVEHGGGEPIIFSKKRKSFLFGAQYLHKPIPEVTDRERYTEVHYHLRGTSEDYRRKVYGRMWDGTVSPEDLDEDHTAWDIRSTYDVLWDRFEDRIQDFDIDPAGVRFISDKPDIGLVINTIPLQQLCAHGHQFRAQMVVAAGDAPALGINVGGLYRCMPDTVICNGDDNPSWYRLSNIFNHTTVEWPHNIKPPIPTAQEVIKPTETNCDCWPKVLKVGRYGSWTKGVLSHTAYFTTLERMERGETAAATTDDDADMPTLF